MNPMQAAGTGVERASTLGSKYYIDPADHGVNQPQL
jgi:hypothetical protein